MLPFAFSLLMWRKWRGAEAPDQRFEWAFHPELLCTVSLPTGWHVFGRRCDWLLLAGEFSSPHEKFEQALKDSSRLGHAYNFCAKLCDVRM